MLDWPLPLSGLVLIGLGVVVGVGLSVLADAWVRGRAGVAEVMRGMLPNIGAAMTAGALVWIGLLANVELRDIDDASNTVQLEAAALRRLAALQPHLSAPAAQALADGLQAYVREVAEHEWPDMDQGPDARAQTAHDALHVLALHRLGSEAPELRQEFNAALHDMAQARHHRLALAVDRIPGVVWVALLVSTVLVLSFSALAHTAQPLGAGRVLGALLGALLSVQLFTVWVVDRPFAGRISVSPQPLLQALAAPAR